jgi:hypothetical protein
MTGAVIALRSERVAANVKRRIEQMVLHRYGLTVRIGHLELELMPPTVLVSDVSVYEPGVAVPMATLHDGALSISPWPSASGALVIDHLRLDGLRADLDLERLIALSIANRGSDGKSVETTELHVDIHELLIWNLDLVARRGDERVSLSRTDLTMRPAPDGRRDVDLSIGSAHLESGGKDLGLEAQVHGVLVGSIDRPQTLVLHRAGVFLKEVALRGTGAVRLEGAPEIDLQIFSMLNLARLPELWPTAPVLRGAAKLEAQVIGLLARPQARFDLRVDDLAHADHELGDASVTGVAKQGSVQVESFRLVHPRAGELSGSGTLELTEHLPLRMTLRGKNVVLEQLLAASGLPEAWVNGRMTFLASTRGQVRPLALDLELEGELDGLALLNKSHKDPEATAFVTLPPTTFRGPLAISTRAVTLGGVVFDRGGSQMTVQGSMSYDGRTGMEMTILGERVRLPSFGKAGGVVYGGLGSFAAAIEGPYANPTVTATADFDDFAVGDYALGDSKATIVYHDRVMRIERAVGRRGHGRFTGSGAIDYRQPEIQAEAEISITDMAFSDVLETSGVGQALAQRFDASTTGSVSLSGALRAPTGVYQLSSPLLRVDGSNLGAMTLSGGFGDGERRVFGAFEARSGKSSIAAAATVRAGARLELSALLDNASLEALAPLMGNIDVAGTISGRAELAGPPGELSGTVRTTMQNVVSYKTYLGDTKLDGDVKGGAMAIRGTTADGVMTLQGELTLSHRLPYVLTGKFQNAEMARLWPNLAAYDVRTSGTLFSQGLLTDASSMLADVEMLSTRIAYGGVVLEATRTVHVQYAQGFYRLVDLAAKGGGLWVSATGKSGIDGSMAFNIVGGGDLDVARSLVSGVQSMRGQVSASIVTSGTWSEPLYHGTIELVGGALRSGSLSFTDMKSTLVLSGKALEVESLTAKLGGGNLDVTGQMALGAGGEMNLRGAVDSVTLSPSSDLRLSTGGRLELTGSASDLLLSGALTIRELRYTANIDLERLIAKKSVPPIKVTAVDPETAIRLDIAVVAPNNILVTSNVMEAELSADLTVRGTTDRVGLYGNVTSLWARGRYLDNSYNVERASVLFTEEYRVAMEYELRATTRACGIDAVVDVRGKTENDRVVVEATGTDENGPVQSGDVIACLLVGIRRSRESTQGVSDNLPASIDALWAVSGLDREVKRLFPLVDEFRLSSSWSQRQRRTTPRVIVGKDLGPRVQLTYSRALEEVEDQALSVEYQLNDIATMQGSWNSVSDTQYGDFGLDLRLRFEFQ